MARSWPRLKATIRMGGRHARPRAGAGTQALNLGAVRTLVLDEADRMLDMGFEEPIREIAGRTHRDRQSCVLRHLPRQHPRHGA